MKALKETLCQTCRHYIKTVFVSGAVHRCYILGRLKSEAIQCRDYADNKTPDLRSMYASAWLLEKEKQIGFETSQSIFKKPDNVQQTQNQPIVPTAARQ